ncbi:hypothetical protein VNI00_005476 [Paramarasmius palmivorus]|uniref:Uncharacterized protein n=1 Tax=Paramarasmius palmivorus TaxID=297713 RepID=A0AAW0DHU0_9AGAR
MYLDKCDRSEFRGRLEGLLEELLWFSSGSDSSDDDTTGDDDNNDDDDGDDDDSDSEPDPKGYVAVLDFCDPREVDLYSVDRLTVQHIDELSKDKRLAYWGEEEFLFHLKRMVLEWTEEADIQVVAFFPSITGDILPVYGPSVPLPENTEPEAIDGGD